MDNLNVSLSLFNRIPNIIRADLISECFEDLFFDRKSQSATKFILLSISLEATNYYPSRSAINRRKEERKNQHMRNDQRRLCDELIKYQVEQNKSKKNGEWKDAQTPDELGKNSESRYAIINQRKA